MKIQEIQSDLLKWYWQGSFPYGYCIGYRYVASVKNEKGIAIVKAFPKGDGFHYHVTDYYSDCMEGHRFDNEQDAYDKALAVIDAHYKIKTGEMTCFDYYEQLRQEKAAKLAT